MQPVLVKVIFGIRVWLDEVPEKVIFIYIIFIYIYAEQIFPCTYRLRHYFISRVKHILIWPDRSLLRHFWGPYFWDTHQNVSAVKLNKNKETPWQKLMFEYSQYCLQAGKDDRKHLKLVPTYFNNIGEVKLPGCWQKASIVLGWECQPVNLEVKQCGLEICCLEISSEQMKKKHWVV